MSDSRPRGVLIDAWTPVAVLFWNRNKENFFKNSILTIGRDPHKVNRFRSVTLRAAVLLRKMNGLNLTLCSLKMHRKTFTTTWTNASRLTKIIIVYAKMKYRWATFLKYINTRPHSLRDEKINNNFTIRKRCKHVHERFRRNISRSFSAPDLCFTHMTQKQTIKLQE